MSDAYDRARLVELFGDDATTLAEVERDFLATAEGALREIAAAAGCAAIARVAHRLKGASGVIGATALHEIADSLERAARADDLPRVRGLHDVLGREVRRVAAQVAATSSRAA